MLPWPSRRPWSWIITSASHFAFSLCTPATHNFRTLKRAMDHVLVIRAGCRPCCTQLDMVEAIPLLLMWIG